MISYITTGTSEIAFLVPILLYLCHSVMALNLRLQLTMEKGEILMKLCTLALLSKVGSYPISCMVIFLFTWACSRWGVR